MEGRSPLTHPCPLVDDLEARHGDVDPDPLFVFSLGARGYGHALGIENTFTVPEKLICQMA